MNAPPLAAGNVPESLTDFMFHHPDGRQQRVVKFSPVQARRDAEQYERELRASLLNGTFGRENNSKETRVTLAQFAPRFLTYSENNNKHSSVVTKRQLLDDHLLPFFGQMVLSGAADFFFRMAALKASLIAAFSCPEQVACRDLHAAAPVPRRAPLGHRRPGRR